MVCLIPILWYLPGANNSGLVIPLSYSLVTPLRPQIQLRRSDYYRPYRVQKSTLLTHKTITTSANVMPPHSSPRGKHHVGTVTLMTVGALRQGQIGPLQVKITGAAKKNTRTTVEHGGLQAQGCH